MKHFPRILGVVCSLIISIGSPTLLFAQEIPFGVTPKQITVSGVVDAGDNTTFGVLRNGRLTDTYVYEEGARTGVGVSGASYALTFWNVGKMGGTSGYLFWKKDFGHATLALSYIIDKNGMLITEKVSNKKLGLPDGWKMEEAESEPDIPEVTCGLTFTGGPTGTFAGTCGNGATISGRVAGTGAFIIFEKIIQPEDPKMMEWALSFLSHKDLRMNGEFADWKFDEGSLEDSGARFSSINGEVEVRHDNDTQWHFAKLDTVLYVFDHVRTSEESQAIIGFKDLSTFLLKEESEIVVTTPPKKDSKLKLVAGTIMGNIKKMLKDGTMEVEMSQAVAGIKGTRFILTETGTTSSIMVTEGTVAFRAKKDGAITMVTRGEAHTVTENETLTKTTFDAATLDQTLLAETNVATPSTPTTPEPTRNTTSPSERSPIIPLAIGLGVITLLAVLGRIVRRTQSNPHD